MKTKTCNMFTAVPFALWSGIISFLIRVLMDINSTVQRLNLLIAMTLMNIVIIFYYILLNNYLKSQPKGISKYKIYCFICPALGTAFTIFSFVITYFKH